MSDELKEFVDDLIARPKLVAGVGDWQNGPFLDQKRWIVSLISDNEVLDLKLVVDAYPSEPVPRYTVTLNLGRCVARLDGWINDRHRNHPIKGRQNPADITMGWLHGPHCHLWKDNRHLVLNNILPEELEYAIALPGNVQGFANAFRWFLGLVNVSCGPDEFPSLPPRERLI